jgi:copper(I)-binding protein
MRLVGVKTAAAQAVGFQLMTRKGSDLRMDPVEAVDLPGGTPVTFRMAPGHYHLLLKHTDAHLRVGDVVPMIAIVEQTSNGAKQSIRFNAKVVMTRGQRAAIEEDGDH